MASDGVDRAAKTAQTRPHLRIQLLSDLHLETEDFRPEPADGAELLVLAGDIDASWRGYEHFAHWPVPVIAVAGNHEFDGREWLAAWPALRSLGESLGLRWLENDSWTWRSPQGLLVRWVGGTRWSGFDLFGEEGRVKAERSGAYFQRLARSSMAGRPCSVAEIRQLADLSRSALHHRLDATAADPPESPDLTIAVTHFAPSLRCADPRYGLQPSTASFCNPDDALLPHADVWLHGHVHCRHDFEVAHSAGSKRATTRIVSAARGHHRRGETQGYDRQALVVVQPPAQTAASGQAQAALRARSAAA